MNRSVFLATVGIFATLAMASAGLGADSRYDSQTTYVLSEPHYVVERGRQAVVARIVASKAENFVEAPIKVALAAFDEIAENGLGRLEPVPNTHRLRGRAGLLSWTVKSSETELTGMAGNFSPALVTYTNYGENGVLAINLSNLAKGEKQFGVFIYGADFKPLSNVLFFTRSDFASGSPAAVYRQLVEDVKSPQTSANQAASESKLDVLPAYRIELRGQNEVRIRNPNTFAVTAGIRAGHGGKNLVVPSSATRSVYVPDGNYRIYFVYSTKPDALFQGDDFSLRNSGVEIQIVKVVGGNYRIRQVK